MKLLLLFLGNIYGLRHMTSDLLVDYKDGHQAVYSIKYRRSDLMKDAKKTASTMRKLWIEKQYWLGRNVEWNLVFTSEMNRVYAENISEIVYHWQPSTVVDNVSLFKHLAAHKKIKLDLESHPIDPLEYKMRADMAFSKEEATRLIEEIRNSADNTE